MFRKIRSFIMLLMLLVLVRAGEFTVYAQEAEYQNTVIVAEGFGSVAKLSDASRSTYADTAEGGTVTISREDGISALYIEFDRIPAGWRLTEPASGVSVSCGENGFLHEYVDVASLFGTSPQSLVMSFEAGTVIADIYGFGAGELPHWVQIWEPPCKEADLLLFSSHSDDEQLFFSGILPYYAGEQGLKVQVAYIVQHFQVYNTQNHQRPHEQLDGLWTVGVRNYPVMSNFPDLYAESKDRATAFSQALAVFESVGITYDDFLCYMTECLRRFKPLVVVSHDLDGEYGHGTHVLCASALTEAIGYAGDESKYPESAVEYGTWQIQKAYLHLYEENPIVMNFDVPLDRFGGKTAFEVSQEGFGCHKSQHWTWFYKWMYGTEGNPVTKATDITKYSPCLYGLYYTNVGLDTEGGDFFENVETYEEQALAQQQAKLEEERKAKLEEERKSQEEAKARAEEKAAREREEECRRQAEEEARLAKEKAEAAAKLKVVLLTISGAVICVGIMIIVIVKKRRKGIKSHRK